MISCRSDPLTQAQRKLLREMGPFSMRDDRLVDAAGQQYWLAFSAAGDSPFDLAVLAMLNHAASEPPEVVRDREALLMAARKGLGPAVMHRAHMYRDTVREAKRKAKRR